MSVYQDSKIACPERKKNSEKHPISLRTSTAILNVLVKCLVKKNRSLMSLPIQKYKIIILICLINFAFLKY